MTERSKNSLLGKWMKRQQGEHRQSGVIQPRPDGQEVPLSYRQERLWFLQQLYPGNPFYHYSEGYEFAGKLNVEIFFESISYVIRRHEVLRTYFVQRGDQVVQKVSASTEFATSFHDLRSSGDTEREHSLQRIVLEESKVPFDLGVAPLLRVTVIQTEDERHLIAFTIHHLIMDKWSMRLLRSELAQVYGRLTLGYSVSFDPLPLQYGDYAYWQREGELNKRSLDYWYGKLGGELPQLQLPFTTERPRTLTHRGALDIRTLDADLSRSVERYCQQTNTTRYTFLLTVYKLLLARLCHESDIIVGSPFTERSTTQLEDLIGFFDDTLVIRSDLSGQPDFKDLLQQVKANVLEAIENRDTPFEVLVKELNPQRSLNQNPIFQTMFIFHEETTGPSFGNGLEMRKKSLDIGVAKFDLTLYVELADERITTIFEYATDIYDKESVERIHNYYLNLLREIIGSPDQAITSYNFIAREELDQLSTWGEHPVALPTYDSIGQLFERTAHQVPDKTAVSHQEKTLSYRQLDRLSNVLGSYLAKEGVEVGDRIGLCAQPSPELAIGILGIIKAGAAYVPIDPDMPPERSRYMLDNAGAGILLVQQGQGSNINSKGLTSLTIEKILEEDKGQDVTTRVDELNPGNLAYVLYTSGSTGKPKGVEITHGSLLNSTLARSEYYPSDPQSFLLLSSFTFDSSVAGIFWTLTTGGKLVLPVKRIEQDAEVLGKLISKEAVTHTLMLPSLYETLLALIPQGQLQIFQTVIVAGESSSATLRDQHFDKLPGTKLYNEYGPTEATVWATVHQFQADDPAGLVSIGSPIPNAEVYVLDRSMNRVPAGITGELYIGGKNVAKGYINKEGLTADRFVSNPFNASSGPLYRTGDRVSYSDTGELIFHGRGDEQFKIRGHRIELEEIRVALLALPEVEDALVTVSNLQEKGNTILVGYVISKENSQLDLTERLRQKLPEYMIPAVFMGVEKWPLLPNGKIDRNSLPQPSVTNEDIILPESELEKDIAGVWCTVLKIDQLGVNDNFFEIGGDSILSIQIVSRLRDKGYSLAPTDLFDHQTIGSLSVYLSGRKDKVNSTSEVEAYQGPVDLLPIQRWFFDEHKIAPHHWNQAIRFSDVSTDTAQLEASVNLLIERHEALRLTFDFPTDDSPQAIIKPTGESYFHEIKLEDKDTSQVEVQINEVIAELHTTLDLVNGPLFKVVYFNRPNESGHLIILGHHLVVDAVSWQILVDDLVKILSRMKEGKPINLPRIDMVYHRWVVLLHDLAQNSETLPYWESQRISKRLPKDLKGPVPYAEKRVQKVNVTLSESDTEHLIRHSSQAYGTRVDELMILALVQSLASWTQSDGICLGLEWYGRESGDSDLSQTIGWLTCYFPVLLTLNGSELPDQIKSLKEQLRQVPDKGLSYGLLRYFNDQGAQLDQQPQVIFNYLGHEDDVARDGLGKLEVFNFSTRSPESERHHLLEINAMTGPGGLRVEWSYCQDIHQEETINRVAGDFKSFLQKVIAHCLDQRDRQYTPSDFPEAELDQGDLDKLLGRIG